MSDLIQEVKAALQAQEERLLGSTTTLLMNAPTWLKQLTDRVETAERQRDEANKAILKTVEELKFVPAEIENLKKQLSEAVNALEWYGDERKYELIEVKTEESEIELVSDALQDEGLLARTTLKRIKGDTQAEGHQSTESTQAQAGGRIGGSHE